MSTRLLSLFLVASLPIAGILAGCTSETKSASEPTTEPGATEPEPPPPGSGTPDIALKVQADVASALAQGGLKVDTLPDSLDEILKSRSKTDAVMKSFTLALGVDCSGCHAGSGRNIDYEAATPQKNVTKKMWTNFVRGLKAKEGSLYCDSCHQGKMKYLDRSDIGTLETWMQTNFVEKLERRDGAEHDCVSCHGEPFKGDFIRTWKK